MKWLQGPNDPLPDTHLAWPPGSDAPGLLAAGGELTPERLTQAYGRGIFPWYSQNQPILWWSPPSRMVLHVNEFKVSRSLRKTLVRFRRSLNCEVRIDSDFRRVISLCAHTKREGQRGTWIVDEMIDAFCHLHDLGIAHSVETWIDGELVGGLYGVGFGRMFFGESMFSLRTDASKIALAGLVSFCAEGRVPLIDCQMYTEHLTSLGGRELSRREFEAHIALHVNAPAITHWAYHPAMWAHVLPTSGGTLNSAPDETKLP